jgi:hypothetical protein
VTKEAQSQDAGNTEGEQQGEENKEGSNADTGGAGTGHGNSETGGETSGFKPITSEAELASWKDSVRKELLAQARKDATAEATRKAEEEAAKEKGEFEKLATSRAERIAELEREVAERDRRELRARVAAAHKLPAELAAMLTGDDESALTESAKLLAKHIKPVAAPDTEGGVGKDKTSSDGTNTRPRKDEKKVGPAFTIEGKQKVPWGGTRAAAAQSSSS